MKIKNRERVKEELIMAQKRVTRRKLERVGEMLVSQIKAMLEMEVGRPTKLTETVQYEIKGNKLFIFSNNEIFTYFHEGTKEHKIRPKKPGGSLKFATGQVVQRSDGSKVNAFESMYAKEVNHPGTEAKPVIRQAIFQSKNKILQILNS